MNKCKLIFYCVITEIFLIIAIAIAAMYDGLLFYLFYNGVYGLLLSVTFPIILLLKSKEGFASVGIRKIGRRQILVLLSFVLFSISGQLIPLMIEGKEIRWHLLSICIVPLIMTTFFEEFLFRGFIQTRVEKEFGSVIAVVVSGLMFSLYHLGYPDFRTIEDTLLLLAVGLGFALAYKLADNNLIVSYFVNLPNAFVTYMLKAEQFPTFTFGSSIFAVITVVVIIIGIIMFRRHVNE